MLPEPRQCYLASFLVRVLALPIVEDQSWLWECLERVLLLDDWLLLLFLVVLWLLSLRLLLRFGRRSRSFSFLGLLLGWGVLDRLLDEDRIRYNGFPGRLVHDCLVPTSSVRVAGAPFLVENVLEAACHDASREVVRKGDSLANEEGVDEKVLLVGIDGFESCLLMILNGLLVVRVTADEGAEPASNLGQDLMVGIREPAKN